MSVHGTDPRTVNVQDLLDRMGEPPPRWVHLLVVALALIGVVGFIAGLLAEPERAWTALVWNWAFWTGLSMGGAVLVAAVATANGRWLRPVRRLAEGLTAFLPISFLLMIVLFFGLEHVYPWVEDPPPAKAAYLDPAFFVVRQLIVMTVLMGLAMALVLASLRPDLGRLKERVGGWRRGLYDRMTGGWRGLEEEVERSHRVRERLAPALIVSWAVLWTVWAWDWIMSVDPHWFSTLFGAWMFMSYFLGALGATAVLACLVRPYRSFPELIDRRVLHDLGKMVFAFTVFWTYLFFAQYLVIWYGRLPEETAYVKLRLWQAYQPLATVVFAAVFLVPFVGLLGIRPKRTPALLTTFSISSLLGLWLLHALLVAPGPFPTTLTLGWIETAVAAGMLGLFALAVLAFQAAFPTIALAAGLPPDPDTERLAALTEPHHH